MPFGLLDGEGALAMSLRPSNCFILQKAENISAELEIDVIHEVVVEYNNLIESYELIA